MDVSSPLGRKLKILVIAPTPFFADRGTHIRILEEALALEKLGHTITLVTYHIGGDIPEGLGSRIDVRRIRRWLFWYHKLEAGPDWQKILLDLLLMKKTFSLARSIRPDIIHGHLHEGALIGFVAQRLLFWQDMKLVTDLHGSLVKEMVSHAYLGQGVLRRFFRFLEERIDRLGEVAVTSSWENTEEVKQIRGGKKTETLLDGVRLEMFQGLPERRVLRKRYGVPEDRLVVVYTGALIPNKGIRFLLEAIPLVVARHANAHFVIAGFPLDGLNGYLKTAVFQKHVTVLSPLSYLTALPSVLSLADIGVDPKEARVKQASGKLLQYMGAGLPVACFDTQNNREYLGEGGRYAPLVSTEGLAETLSDMLANPQVLTKQGDLNRKRAERFTWEQSARRLEKIYRTLLTESTEATRRKEIK